MSAPPLSALAERVGCDVDTLLARIGASEELCAYIAHKLTLTYAEAAGDETLLTPASPISPLPCRLALAGNRAECRYPEPHQGVIAAVKTLGWRWDDLRRVWHIQGGRTGPALDRLAEAGCALLAAGFIVAAPNADVAQRIRDGDYRPPQLHWVAVLTTGPYAGWFYITWGRGEDMYRTAMRLHGARYAKPGVACPPEAYDEVLDFADEHGYSLTEGALKLADAARGRLWAAEAVAEPIVRKRAKLAVQSERPIVIAVPETVEIDDDLRD